jgi:hypothetical protein
MIDNAVAHYTHLLNQGKTVKDALYHTRLRYGVSEEALWDRIHGLVANPWETRIALAAAKEHLTQGDGNRSRAILQHLYEAITGESL